MIEDIHIQQKNNSKLSINRCENVFTLTLEVNNFFFFSVRKKIFERKRKTQINLVVFKYPQYYFFYCIIEYFPFQYQFLTNYFNINTCQQFSNRKVLKKRDDRIDFNFRMCSLYRGIKCSVEQPWNTPGHTAILFSYSASARCCQIHTRKSDKIYILKLLSRFCLAAITLVVIKFVHLCSLRHHRALKY